MLAHHPESGAIVARLGRLSLLSNNVQQAIELLSQALTHGHRSRGTMELLADAYYRKHDFAAAAYCYQRLRRLGLAATLAAMAELSPYSLTGGMRRVTLPWLVTEPLPVVRAEINARPANLVLDTGTGELLLDREFAVAAGIRHGGQERRSFAAGQTAPVTYGHAEELGLGGLQMHHLPVQILGIDQHFPAHFPGIPIHGILGTAVLSRFTATLDYRERRLTLDPAQPSAARPRGEDASGDNGIPFWIAENYLPLAHGHLSSAAQRLLFIDTGMAGASLALSGNAANALGLQTEHDLSEKGLGGGGLVTGRRVRVGELRLDHVRRDQVEAMVLPAFPLETRFGFHVHALVAHAFFHGCRLTLDFPRMRISVRS